MYGIRGQNWDQAYVNALFAVSPVSALISKFRRALEQMNVYSVVDADCKNSICQLLAETTQKS
jgi:hypothetical protein